jgi:hypothetical protein
LSRIELGSGSKRLPLGHRDLASVHNQFNHERHLVDRQTYKARREVALAEGQLLAA